MTPAQTQNTSSHKHRQQHEARFFISSHHHQDQADEAEGSRPGGCCVQSGLGSWLRTTERRATNPSAHKPASTLSWRKKLSHCTIKQPCRSAATGDRIATFHLSWERQSKTKVVSKPCKARGGPVTRELRLNDNGRRRQS